jgi:hypothetical protein
MPIIPEIKDLAYNAQTNHDISEKIMTKFSPEVNVPGGSITMQSAPVVRTTALIISNRWINHSFEAKLWKKALAFISIRSRFFSKKQSSSSKALIVAAPATVSFT